MASYAENNSYSNITANATTVIKAGSGVLNTITFNGPVATGTVSIFDNTAGSGTSIGVITTPASPMPVTLNFNVRFSTGLTIVTAVAAQNITVSYK